MKLLCGLALCVVATVSAALVGPNGACTADANCVDNAACNTSVCTCKAGYSPCVDSCVKSQVKLGQKCSSLTDCRGTSVVCDTGECRCAAKTEPDSYNANCVPSLAKLKESCTNKDCGVAYSECKSSVCDCAAGYAADNGTTKCELVVRKIDDTCSLIQQCPTNATCSTTCQCSAGFTANAAKTQCDATVGKLDDSCTFNGNCDKIGNALCTTAKCQCASGYKKDTAGTGCVLDDKDLDQACFIDKQCKPKSQPVTCNTTCQCIQGYRTSSNDCVKSKVTDPCNTARQCPTNADCTTSTCKCKAGYKQSADLSTCDLDKLLFDGACSISEQCDVKNAYCAANGKCDCRAGYKRSGDQLSCDLDVRKMSEGCVSVVQCLGNNAAANALTKCEANVCKCIAGYDAVSALDGCVLNKVNVDGRCTATNQCPSNANCTVDGVCKCAAFYAANAAKTTCDATKRYLHDPCVDTRECAVANSICDLTCQKACACLPGYVERAGVCDKPLIGEVCSNTVAYNYCPGNASCGGADLYTDRCVCRAGYAATSDAAACLPALNGTTCASDNDCGHMANALCSTTTNTCQCRDGYRPSTDLAFCNGAGALGLALLPALLLCVVALLSNRVL